MATITLQEGTTGQTAVYKSTITKVDNKAIDTLYVEVSPTLTVNLNDEVLYYDQNNNFIFGGYVKKIVNESVKKLTVYDYGVQMVDRMVNEVYRDMSPEAIIQAIINNYTDLTFNSTIVSNTTISKIVFKDIKIIDAVKQVSELLKANFRTDENKNFYLEFYSEKASNKVIVEGVDVNVSGWNYNTDKQATKVIIKGAPIKTTTVEQITGTATEFTLTRIPNDLRVTVGGVELTQTVDGQIDGDYTVDKQAKKVIFNTSQTDPIFEYTYDSQIKVQAGDGTIEKEIVKTYIESMQEARTLARAYLSTYKDGILTATFEVPTLDMTEYQPNYKIKVTDTIRNPPISEFFHISKCVRNYPGTLRVTVGEQEGDIFDWQKETIERVKQLESKDDNSDFIQVYEFIEDKLSIKLTVTVPRYQYRSITGNGFYLNDPVKGVLNSTYLVKSTSDGGTWTDI